MGRSPTTSAIAGTVSGSRQMNSTMRLRPGSLSRTQTMVGSSRTSMVTDVITASSSEAVMASVRVGVLKMLAHASSVRGAVSVLPRVENSSMPTSGVMKNAPITRKTTTLKIWSLRFLDRFNGLPQPARRAALEEAVQRHHDGHDHDHRQRQRLGQPWLRAPDLAHEDVLDLQGHDHPALRDQHRGGRVCGEGVRKQQQGAAEE